jgi:hypothetical protein
MSIIVICPNCKQVNIGSKLICVKCQASLIGVQRTEGESPLPDFTPTPEPEEQWLKQGQGKPAGKNK